MTDTPARHAAITAAHPHAANPTVPTPTRRASRRAAGVAALLGTGLVVAACGIDFEIGSGDVVTTPFEVADFDRIEVDAPYEVIVEYGDEHHLEIDIDDNLVDHLRVDVVDGRLELDLAGGAIRADRFVARITTPDLTSIDLDGAARATVENDADHLEVDIDGASRLVLTGTIVELEVDLDGAGRVDAEDASVGTATIDLDGASILDLADVERVDGRLDGASLLVADDQANVVVDTSGVSRIRRV